MADSTSKASTNAAAAAAATSLAENHHLAVDPALHSPPPPPLHGTKEKPPALDSEVPLSPQWLLPKTGDKSATKEPNPNPNPKREPFRPSSVQQHTDTGSRWRDDERETNPTPRRPAGTTKWTPSWRDNRDPRPEKEDNWRNKDEHRDPRERDGEKEEITSRPWKPSSVVGRGRGETMDPAPGLGRTKTYQYGYGRGGGTGAGRGENGNSNPGYSRGRFGSRSYQIGESGSSETGLARYSRMKLLDVYKSTDLKNFKLPNGEIPKMPFVQDEPSQPFAFSMSTADELVVLKGIEKGDITGSYQAKDSSLGRNEHKEEMPLWMEDDNDNDKNKPNPKQFSAEPGLLDRSSSMKKYPNQESLQSPNNSTDPYFSRKTQTPQMAPEDLSLFYKDPHGQVQGPFSGADIIGWYEAAYFGIDLLVRLQGATNETPFIQLGEMMPHLKAKTRPPPGFAETGTVSTVGTGSGTQLGVPGKGHAVEEQNRFLESLMSGTGGPGFGSFSLVGENQNAEQLNYFLAQKRLMERQKSIPNVSQYTVPTVPVPQNTDHTPMNNNSSSMFSKLLPSNNNNSSPSPSPSILSKLLPPMEMHSQMPVQAPVSVPVSLPVPNHAFPLWSNVHNVQNPNLPQPNPINPQIGQVQPRSMNQLNHQNQVLSEISQDPQLLGLLQQQYLLQQASPLAAPVSPQLSLMDKYLLLKQQQQQHQQQQQQLLMQKQQELLSHAVWQSNLNVQNPSLGFPGMQVPGMQVPQAEASPLNLPHQMFDHIPVQVPVPVPVSNNQWDQASISASNLQMEKVKTEQSNQVLNNNNVSKPEDFFWGSSADVTTQINDIRISEENPENVPEKEIRSVASNEGNKAKIDNNVPESEIKAGNEGKKTAEKKSKKQKSAKKKIGTEADSSEPVKTGTGTQKEETEVKKFELPLMKALEVEFDTCGNETEQDLIGTGTGTCTEANQGGPSKWGWKQTQSPRPKSLTEIQAEEQLRAKRNPVPVSVGTTLILEAKPVPPPKSPLHDVLAEEVIAKSNELERDVVVPVRTATSAYVYESPVPVEEDDFIEAKELKKNRKKSKAKSSGTKPASSPQVDVNNEKNKSGTGAVGTVTRQVITQHEEILPAPPAGPSLGDFIWKGDSVTLSVQPPVWSSNSKHQKSLSLREIQKEQERKAALNANSVTVPVVTAPVLVPVPNAGKGRGNNGSWQASPSNKSPVPVPVPVQSSTSSSQGKGRTEDDFFWGPVDSKQDSKQSEFPSLTSQSGKGGKGNSARDEPVPGLNRQKSARTPAPPAQPVTKGARVDESTKYNEAIDFRSWCGSEWARITGTTDTSFLEYCIKQSPNEAEMLLRENLGKLDKNHEFIDQFLNYKSFLSPDVLEMAFSPNLSLHASTGSGSVPVHAGNGSGMRDFDKGKKGKKGKKVSSNVLGFNVVSNRIMMGEIQNPDA